MLKTLFPMLQLPVTGEQCVEVCAAHFRPTYHSNASIVARAVGAALEDWFPLAREGHHPSPATEGRNMKIKIIGFSAGTQCLADVVHMIPVKYASRVTRICALAPAMSPESMQALNAFCSTHVDTVSCVIFYHRDDRLCPMKNTSWYSGQVIGHLAFQDIKVMDYDLNSHLYGSRMHSLMDPMVQTQVFKTWFWMEEKWHPFESWNLDEMRPLTCTAAMVWFACFAMNQILRCNETRSVQEEVQGMRLWARSIMWIMESNHGLFDPDHEENLVMRLFGHSVGNPLSHVHTKPPKDPECILMDFMKEHSVFSTLSQYYAPLLVWFLIHFTRNLRLNLLKNKDAIVWQNCDADRFHDETSLRFESKCVIGEFMYGVVHLYTGGDLFVWENPAEKGKGGGQQSELQYGGLRVGDVVKITLHNNQRVTLYVTSTQGFDAKKTRSSAAAGIKGNPNTRGCMGFMTAKEALSLVDSTRFKAVKKCSTYTSFEQLHAILDLQPSPYHWLTPMTGFPLHGKYLCRFSNPAQPLTCRDKLFDLVMHAQAVRKLCRENSSWKEMEICTQIFLRYFKDTVIRHGGEAFYSASLEKRCKAAAQLLVPLLCSDSCQLWDTLLVMMGFSNAGEKQRSSHAICPT